MYFLHARDNSRVLSSDELEFTDIVSRSRQISNGDSPGTQSGSIVRMPHAIGNVLSFGAMAVDVRLCSTRTRMHLAIDRIQAHGFVCWPQKIKSCASGTQATFFNLDAGGRCAIADTTAEFFCIRHAHRIHYCRNGFGWWSVFN
jgi:hypothetical protein